MINHFMPGLGQPAVVRRTFWLVLVAAALGLAGCSAREAQAAAPGEQGDGPPFYDLGFHEYDCPFEVLQGEEITCGYLTVPQDREIDDGITIDLAVAIIKASGSRPRQDPILYLEGGPGGSALSDPDYWLDSPLHTAPTYTPDSLTPRPIGRRSPDGQLAGVGIEKPCTCAAVGASVGSRRVSMRYSLRSPRLTTNR